jgi:hypothetical protein
MTLPVFHEITQGTHLAFATSHSVALPPVINAGDLVIGIFSKSGAGSVGWDDVTAGEWEALDDAVNASGYCRQVIRYRFCDGSEEALNLAITTSDGAYCAWQFYRYSSADAVVCATANTTQGNTIAPDPPALVTGWGTVDIAVIPAISIYSPNGTPSPPNPFGLTPVFTNAGNVVGLDTARANMNANGFDPSPFTLSGSPISGRRYTVSQTIAVRGSSVPIIGASPVLVRFTVPSPSVAALVSAPALTLRFEVPEPNIATEQTVEVEPVELNFSIPEPRVFEGIGPEPVKLVFAVPAPTVVREFYDIDPQPVTLRFVVPKPNVAGGARTHPRFDRVSIGDAPGPVSDLAIYSGFTEGAAFAQRFDTRGPIGFLDFVPFEAGEKEFSDACIWLRLDVKAVERTFAILSLIHISEPTRPCH